MTSTPTATPPRTPTRLWRNMPAPPFIQAHDWRRLGRNAIRGIVVHTAECSESRGAASSVAHWFATSRAPIVGSSHLVIDDRAVWECIRPYDEAYGAKGGDVNATCYHVELCGRASQGVAGWADTYSTAQLILAAKALANVSLAYEVPIVRLTPTALAAGASGFVGHRDVTAAYHVPGGHNDPGPDFPWDTFLRAVATECALIETP